MSCMKKYKYYLGIGFPGAEHEEIVGFPDDVTEADVEEDFQDWMNGYLDAGFYEVEEWNGWVRWTMTKKKAINVLSNLPV